MVDLLFSSNYKYNTDNNFNLNNFTNEILEQYFYFLKDIKERYKFKKIIIFNLIKLNLTNNNLLSMFKERYKKKYESYNSNKVINKVDLDFMFNDFNNKLKIFCRKNNIYFLEINFNCTRFYKKFIYKSTMYTLNDYEVFIRWYKLLNILKMF